MIICTHYADQYQGSRWKSFKGRHGVVVVPPPSAVLRMMV
eukprot:CAMPEP_0119483042 /NCGR_PEP_ID=MMETSP1344-20130328/10629_1 /TAXON_ID=236787 /ORGANISM="Florenciella parvula, Strain CCMP2471" /LENGTH=39 /DNA_ID= /DNA_START= /DNA_END= /DNA_ORIENTATION=